MAFILWPLRKRKILVMLNMDMSLEITSHKIISNAQNN